MLSDQIIANLKQQANAQNVEGMARFGIRPAQVLGISMPTLRKMADEAFLQFFPLIKHYADDERNFVKKAVNWALRQIGKRNSHLRTLALECAYDIQRMDSKTAQWLAKDALKELQAKEIKDEPASYSRERKVTNKHERRQVGVR